MFKLYPEQRRIQVDEVDLTVLSSKTMGTAEQKRIIEGRHDISVFKQDIYNLQRRLGIALEKGLDDNTRCQDILRELIRNGGCGELGRDEGGDFLFVAFATCDMLNLLKKFPECLVMNCTNNYLYPLLTIMIIDGEGKAMPVFHAYLAKEDMVIMESCLRIFAQQLNTETVRCFVVEKDIAEIAADISAAFRGIPVNLCYFHISQAVERYLQKEFPRDNGRVRAVLDIFMRQVTTESEEEFAYLKRGLSQMVPQPVIGYFEDNWWSKRHLWAACCNVNVVKFNSTTTNALERYNSKLKKVVKEKMCLSNVIKIIVNFDSDMLTERGRKLLISSNSVVNNFQDKDNISSSITSSLTPFGAHLVREELSLSSSVSYSLCGDLLNSDSSVTLRYREREHICSAISCSCSVFGHFQLPCRHIFFVRQRLSLPVFVPSLVPDSFQKSSTGILSDPVTVSSGGPHAVADPSSESSTTVEGRFKQTKTLCDRIVNHLSNLGASEFGEKLSQLEDLISRWSSSNSHNVVVSNDVVPPQDNVVRPDSVVHSNSNDVKVFLIHTGVNSNSKVECPKLRLLMPKPPGLPDCSKQFAKSQSPVKRRRTLPKIYAELSSEEKKELLLRSVTSSQHFPSRLLGEADLKVASEISDHILDDKVDVSSLVSFFEPSAWLLLMKRFESRVQGQVFDCGLCREIDDGTSKMIQCEHCLCWFHFKCVSHSSGKIYKKWFCVNCI